MKKLFAFILKHNFVVVFILMQIFCYSIMVNREGFQGSKILNSSNAFTANVYQTAANTQEYFSLKQQNQILSFENAQLRNLLKSNYTAIPLKLFTKNDTLYEQQYSYLSAKVVNASVNRRRNYLTINIGKNQGVDRDMAVIASNGIVGIVTDVSEHFASVMSVLHKDVRINCQLKKDGSYGPLIWDGKNYEYCNLTDIPTHAKIKKGDTVITSELSGIFPEGIMVGTIDKFERKQNEPFYTAKVKLSTDLKIVNFVYVIKNKFKTERDSLEINTQKQIDD